MKIQDVWATEVAATTAKSHLRGTEEKALLNERQSAKADFVAVEAVSTAILYSGGDIL
jgi:hypothetical protein